jgi:hypothetical protein
MPRVRITWEGGSRFCDICRYCANGILQPGNTYNTAVVGVELPPGTTTIKVDKAVMAHEPYTSEDCDNCMVPLVREDD